MKALTTQISKGNKCTSGNTKLERVDFNKAMEHMINGGVANYQGQGYMIKGVTLYYAHVSTKAQFTVNLYNGKWKLS